MGPAGATCHAAPKESIGYSSAQLVLGQPLMLPGELKDVTEAAAADFSAQLASADPPPTCQPRSYADVAATPLQIPKQLQQACYVYVRRGRCSPPLAPVYSGPFCLLHAGPKTFTLEVGATCETVSVDRLKPHTSQLPVIPAVPVKQGRPRKTPLASSLLPVLEE